MKIDSLNNSLENRQETKTTLKIRDFLNFNLSIGGLSTM